jgi:hypothetical protein
VAEDPANAVQLLLKVEAKGAPGEATYIDLSEALDHAGRTADAVSALKPGLTAFPYSKLPVSTSHSHISIGNRMTRPNEPLEDYLRDFPEDDSCAGCCPEPAELT